MDEDIIKLLDEHNWGPTILKLNAYVIRYCKWNKIMLPAGLGADDIVMNAIEKVYNGDRSWNPEKDPDLFNYLKSVSNSIISNQLQSPRSNTVYLSSGMENESFVVNEQTEEEMYCMQLDNEIAIAMRGDPECCLVYKALKDGYKPSEIAQEYAIGIEAVRNAQKRLRRIADTAIDDLSKVIPG